MTAARASSLPELAALDHTRELAAPAGVAAAPGARVAAEALFSRRGAL